MFDSALLTEREVHLLKFAGSMMLEDILSGRNREQEALELLTTICTLRQEVSQWKGDSDTNFRALGAEIKRADKAEAALFSRDEALHKVAVLVQRIRESKCGYIVAAEEALAIIRAEYGAEPDGPR